jgi:hypothetical protein
VLNGRLSPTNSYERWLVIILNNDDDHHHGGGGGGGGVINCMGECEIFLKKFNSSILEYTSRKPCPKTPHPKLLRFF